jgi:hypothetical protein
VPLIAKKEEVKKPLSLDDEIEDIMGPSKSERKPVP